MMKAFEGIYLMRFDVDQWGWGGEGFPVQAIPIFFRLDAGGNPTGDVIDGGAWGPDTLPNIASTLDPWFHRTSK
jgi:hypothetical protein